MECFYKYKKACGLKTQTIASAVRFMLSVIAFPTLIGRLASFVDDDRLAFNCHPKPNEVAKQGCYSRYTDDMSALLTPYTFTCITGGILLGFWILMILYSVKCLLEIRKAPKRRGIHPFLKFWRVLLLHVFTEAVFLSAMMGLFCHSQTISLPEVYNCPQRNSSMQISSYQKENLICSDWYYKQKSDLNIGILTVMTLILILCIALFGHTLCGRVVSIEELDDWNNVADERGKKILE